jgi:hypothetical protein
LESPELFTWTILVAFDPKLFVSSILSKNIIVGPSPPTKIPFDY